MWGQWRLSKELSCRPSLLLGLTDELAAYSYDSAVVTLGTIVENALQERTEVGAGDSRKSIARYTLKQLLDPAFTLPRQEQGDSLDVLRGGEYYDEVDE